MQLSGHNLSLLKNSIEFNNGDVHDNECKEEKQIFAKPSTKKHEVDSAVFVQTNKDNRTSKIPNHKIELGKNLSNLVLISKFINDIKSGFEDIEKSLNIEAESEIRLPIERKEAIDRSVLEIKTALNDIEVDGKTIFASTFKLNVKIDVGSKEPYVIKIDFNKAFSDFDLDFEGVEDDLDKRFHQIREVNKALTVIEDVQSEVDKHLGVLKNQMDKFISAGKESTLFHLNTKLEDSNLVNHIKLKVSIFNDSEVVALAQSNTNSASVLNLLP